MYKHLKINKKNTLNLILNNLEIMVRSPKFDKFRPDILDSGNLLPTPLQLLVKYVSFGVDVKPFMYLC